MENRDFIGYGENPPNIVWPNKAKIAISVVVNYEEGSEYSLLDGGNKIDHLLKLVKQLDM